MLTPDGQAWQLLDGGDVRPIADRTDRRRLRALSDQAVAAAARADVDALPVSGRTLMEFRRAKAPNVAAIRRRLRLSQPAFAARFGVNVRTVQDWEQGRRQPHGPARILLTLIERAPAVVSKLLDRD